MSNNPLVVSVTDSEGTLTTEIDLLGRPVVVEDIWAQTLETTYDQAGRVTSTDRVACASTGSKSRW